MSRPNIITIFADDMGFSDIGCYGSEIETPNLDKLAANGVRFSQFYNTARCCPARASLLTGLYPHQAGVGMMVYRDYGDGYDGNINDKCVTFGEVLRDAGYQTMMVGKWHAGHEPHARPEVRGFDRFTGIYTHVDAYWAILPACEVYRDGKVFIDASTKPVNPYNPDKEFYTTDFFTDTALDYIDQALEDPDKPFLLHTCYNVPHFPLEAPDELIEKYRGRYMMGWDKLREDKLEKMKAMGLVGPKQKLPEVKGFELEKREEYDFMPTVNTAVLPHWDSMSDDEKLELDFRRAIYAAQIDCLDQNVGRLIAHLEAKGILDNTMILFMSDNGSSGELGTFGMNWGDHNIANYADWRSSGGWSNSQGQCWASCSNAPLRKYKIFVHEGGIASPFIVHWPAGIKDTGRLCTEQMFHLIDIMPTLCEVTGATYPETYQGRTITPMQGISIMDYLQNSVPENEARTLYWQHETHAAIRRKDWKLVTNNDRDDDSWELYEMSEDRSETDDLIQEKPELAADLLADWKQWAEDTKVRPYPEERGNLKRIPWPPRHP